MKVPLPEGWTAEPRPEGGLRVGPPGRVVLRIDRLPDAGALLPSPEELRTAFASGLKLLTLRESGVTRSENFQAVKLTLGRGGKGDGGTPREVSTLLAAKRLVPDLFLCATTPGTSEEELEAAVRVCGGLGTASSATVADGGS